VTYSGARTNLKVGITGPEQKWGHRSGRAPSLFGSKSTLSRFGERVRDGQYSLVSFLFTVFLLTVRPCPANFISGARAPWAPWSRRH